MAVFNTYHYSALGFRGKDLRKVAMICNKVLLELHEKFKFDFVVGTGSSGLTILTAMHLVARKELPFALVYARKPNDDSHGCMLEMLGTGRNMVPQSYLVIDDFVSSGDTIRTIEATIDEKSKAKCIGVLEYNSGCPTHNGEFWEYEGKLRLKNSEVTRWRLL